MLSKSLEAYSDYQASHGVMILAGRDSRRDCLVSDLGPGSRQSPRPTQNGGLH